MSGDSSLGIGIGLALKSYGRGFRGLLNQYPGAAAAYSLRKLSGAVSNVVRVRRASDNDEQDFTAAEVSDGTLESFCGVGDGFVETWYDQSGNGNDATQSVAASQPKIVDGGSLVSGGLDFDGVNDLLNTSVIPTDVATMIGVAEWDANASSQTIIGARDSANQRSHLIQSSAGFATMGVAAASITGSAITQNTTYLIFGSYNGSTRLLSTDGSVVTDELGTNPSNTTYGYSLGALNTAGTNDFFMDGTLAEVIVYNSDQSANRTAIEGNINDYYNIY
jgi:hypothetical protein